LVKDLPLVTVSSLLIPLDGNSTQMNQNASQEIISKSSSQLVI